MPRRGAKSISKCLHGTGHIFQGICPNFTERASTGSELKKIPGRNRDREHFHGISLDRSGIFRIARDHRIISQPVESSGVFTTGKPPRRAMQISSPNSQWFTKHDLRMVYPFFWPSSYVRGARRPYCIFRIQIDTKHLVGQQSIEFNRQYKAPATTLVHQTHSSKQQQQALAA